jgi:protocatechuate 4,5-dioxygenase alpha chain
MWHCGYSCRYHERCKDANLTEQSSPGATYRDAPIAGTTVFTGRRSQKGYRINKLAMSLTNPANRAAFKGDEQTYMRKYGLRQEEMSLIERRDWTGLIEAGGNIYLLIKIAGAVGQNLLEMGAQMRGEALETFLKTRPGHSGTAVERSA